ncbi:MAG: methyl-accepting chemotaxis protein [Planctomycetes bacterium]|nr:methyl-accepting chemotaxis protein [Planctomycetota bacterium]
MSLRSRIALIAGLLLLASIVVTSLLQTWAARRAVLDEVRSGGDRLAEVLARSAALAADVPRAVEAEIGEQMLTESRLLAEVVALGVKAGLAPGEITARLRGIAAQGNVEFLATDEQGTVIIDTDDKGEGWTFSPDPTVQPQAHVFHRLLDGGIPGLVQESRQREIDDKIFKYAGVGGVDRPRIIQVGVEATFFDRIDRNLGLRRLVHDLVAGDVVEVRILDERQMPLVSRRVDTGGIVTDADRPVDAADSALIAAGAAAGRPEGRFDDDGYVVAAPVRRNDGATAGAVLVRIATRASRESLAWQAVAALASGLLVGLPGLLGGVWLARSIAEPVRRSMMAAESIAAGDLTLPVPEGGDDEVGRLLAAFGEMSDSLRGLVGRIQDAGLRLSSTESDAAIALARQERSIHGFRGSAADISAAVTEIATTGEQLLSTTSAVTDVAREAARVADLGRDGLLGMSTSMQHLDEAMNAFTRKLATISQRAAGITTVVTTIAKVADQTNLLSVNATIEAEKAGEAGRGFRIVAQEIRRLADQTALATKDIERMVRDMQAAVASGTMEMDRFRNEVSARITEVSQVSEQLGQIIEPVKSVTQSLDTVHDGMRTQAQGVRQIRDAMEKLRIGAEDSAASTEVFARSLGELRRSIGEINGEASRFLIRKADVASVPAIAVGEPGGVAP